MANQRDKNKRILGVYMDRETYHRLSKLARAKKTTVADITRLQIERMVKDVELSVEDRTRIKKEKLEFAAKQKESLAKKRTFQARMAKVRRELEE
jgi:predicted DNA-binding protein